jgi:hypothetical protein
MNAKVAERQTKWTYYVQDQSADAVPQKDKFPWPR